MTEFVQRLESRQLLSATVNLTVDEGKLAMDVGGIIADAKTARASLVPDGKAVAAQIKALNLKNSPLAHSLSSAISQSRSKLGADLQKIVTAGLADGHAVFSDFLRLELADNGNTAKITADQSKLSADVIKLYNVEKPFTDKLQTDLAAAETKVENAVQAIVNANKSDDALSSSWATLQSDFDQAKQTLSGDFSQVTTDVNQLIADS
ncbi:MAG TPA: hypothetical protein VFE47_09405 [Tepidisphaeraceae bacterium]|jgi:hypothetical protein|nr:hypothetical protein [Tepidisphaeraceae bacterium]